MPTDDSLLSLDDEEEVEEGLPETLIDEIKEVVVFNVDWTVATLIDQLMAAALDLQPQYQRRDAWTLERKSRFIESLLLGLPVPQVVLAERRDQRGSFIVLDGKQRLTTLLQFSGGAPHSERNGFVLERLSILKSMNGMTWSRLQVEPTLSSYRNSLANQPIRAMILRNWQSDDLLHLVFHRLNANGVPLSPQELRQALIRGPFLPYLNDYSAQSSAIQSVLHLSGPDFRMRDSELLLRLLAFWRNEAEYRGNLRKFLDDTSIAINNDWDMLRAEVGTQLAEIEGAIRLWGKVLSPENVGHKFRSSEYEGRFNRAVLDTQVLALKNARAARLLKAHPGEARSKFEALFDRADFVKAIESTTKSVDAFRQRVESVRDALGS